MVGPRGQIAEVDLQEQEAAERAAEERAVVRIESKARGKIKR